MSFELKISARDRMAGRFIGAVRKALLVAALEEKERSGVTQQSIAAKLGINRSVINRLLRGEANLTLRSVAELAWALGRVPRFDLPEQINADGSNYLPLAGHSAPVPPSITRAEPELRESGGIPESALA